MITKLKSEEQLLKTLGEKPTRYPLDMVIANFHAVRRRRQIDFALDGKAALSEEIKDFDKLEEQVRLKLTCFFANPKGDLEPLGILASYISNGKGCLLWWTPEEEA